MVAKAPSIIVGFDTETDLMREGHVQPEIVCLTLAVRSGPKEPIVTKLVVGRDDIVATFSGLLLNPDVLLVAANTAYDTAGPFLHYPEIRPLLLDALIAERFDDVILREKLYNLSQWGVLESERTPNGGQGRPIMYGLDSLEKKHIGRDRSDQKEDADAWRLRYIELKDIPAERWPQSAVEYALADAEGALLVWECQERLRRDRFYGATGTSREETKTAFALRLWEAHGFAVDPEAVAKVDEHLAERLSPERMAPLYEAGLLTPAKPPRPHKKRESKKPKTEAQLAEEAEKPVKMTKAVPEKLNKKELQEHVFNLSKEHGRRLFPTDKTIELRIPREEWGPKNISTSGEALLSLADLDENLALLSERQDLIKVQTTFMPNLKGELGRFHPGYNVLVSTGRTSCRTVKDKQKRPIYPSGNVQNLPRKGDIRECLVADEGCVLLAVDYDALELCSVAQTTYSLFGESQHLEVIRAGKDPHAYLGSALAAALHPEFAAYTRGMDRDEVYATFVACKNHPSEELAEFYAHWRTFAKPTGLGYPGGLGPKTFIEFARTTYDVTVDLEMATRLRELWHETYPEMRRYFKWVSQQRDRSNDCQVRDPETGEPKTQQRYAYETPHGMWRAGCLFTEIANGKAMQSPSAVGAKRAVFETTLACWDPRRSDGVLFGCRPVAFIHDEIIMNVPEDRYLHERAEALGEIMVRNMQGVMPDVPISTEATLMRRWTKKAKPVFDEAGRLQVWEPKAALEAVA